MDPYTRLFRGILHSTVWREPSSVRVVWVTMLALADRDGEVHASVPGLADVARVTLDECQAALTRLGAPDAWSRSTAEEGRRIVPIDGGWRLVNHAKYRDAGGEREAARVRQARHRAKVEVTRDSHAQSPSITPSSSSSSSSISEEERLRLFPNQGVGATRVECQKKPRRPPTQRKYSAVFEGWWAAYPRRIGKQAAAKAHAAAVAGGVAADQLQATAAAYAAAVARWPEADRQYVPYPATWLNRGSYDDEPAAWERREPAPRIYKIRS